MQLDRSQLRDPHQRGQVLDHAVVHVPVVAVAPDPGGIEPRRAVLGAVLLVEHLALDAVRVALEGEGAIAEVGQQRRCDSRVVLDHLALGEADPGVEHLVQVGQPEGAFADPDLHRPLGRAHVDGFTNLRMPETPTCGSSLTTFRGSLSFRSPLKAPARICPARVHSANSKSPTRRGSTKWVPAGVRPVVNGESERSRGFNWPASRASMASVKPVPTLPAYLSSGPSQ